MTETNNWVKELQEKKEVPTLWWPIKDGDFDGLMDDKETVGENIPEEIKKQIDALDENNNELWMRNIQSLPVLEEIITYIELQGKARFLKTLTITQSSISTVPESIGNLFNLQNLYLPDNNLEYLPESIWNLSALKVFNAADNNLKSLPDSFKNLSLLTHIYLHRNKFVKFPEGLYSITNVQYLYMFQNEIENISDSIWKLTSLKHLWLDDNKITTLPASFWNLIKLETLSLNWNRLKEIPETFWKLSLLQVFSIMYNPLINLPDAIRNLPWLSVLYLSSRNPFLKSWKIPEDKDPKLIVIISWSLDYPKIIETKPENLNKEHYNNFAKNDPNNFIKLLEDARIAEDNDDKTIPVWDKIPTRQAIVQMLDVESLMGLLTLWRQELLSAFQSTFGYIFNALCTKDFPLLWGMKQRQLLTTIVQFIPRYMHLKIAKTENIDRVFLKVNVSSLLQPDTYSVNSIITYLFPILDTFKKNEDKMYSFLYPLLRNFFTELEMVSQDTSQKHDVNLTNLLMNYIYTFDKTLLPKRVQDRLKWQDRSMFTIDIERYKTLSCERTKEKPGITHMYFDNDEDGKINFHNFLNMVWLHLWEKPEKIEKRESTQNENWLMYALNQEKIDTSFENWKSLKEPYYRIDVKNKQWEVVHKIYFNRPQYAANTMPFPWEPDIVVDRGHAGKEKAWLQAITENTKLILIWSCGGYAKLADALSENTNIQVIATTSTGSKAVNDPIVRTVIHQGITNGQVNREKRTPDQTLVDAMHPDMKKEYNTHRPSYMLPPEHTTAAFKAKYAELSKW